MKIVFQTVPRIFRDYLPRLKGRLVGDELGQVAPGSTQPVLSPPPAEKKPSLLAWVAVKSIRLFLLIISLISMGVLAVVFIPDVYYRLFPVDTQPVVNYQQQLASQSPGITSQLEDNTDKIELPDRDESLPQGSWLVIPRIGIRTQLQATTNPEEALQVGVWQVPDYGQPGDTDLPTIVAGHRFGWQWWWKTDYWKYHSFYNLPQLEVGDRIEVIADQCQWIYQVYATQQGQEITDYQSDLIMYTCKYLNSPVRYFVYARLTPTSGTTD